MVSIAAGRGPVAGRAVVSGSGGGERETFYTAPEGRCPGSPRSCSHQPATDAEVAGEAQQAADKKRGAQGSVRMGMLL